MKKDTKQKWVVSVAFEDLLCPPDPVVDWLDRGGLDVEYEMPPLPNEGRTYGALHVGSLVVGPCAEAEVRRLQVELDHGHEDVLVRFLLAARAAESWELAACPERPFLGLGIRPGGVMVVPLGSNADVTSVAVDDVLGPLNEGCTVPRCPWTRQIESVEEAP